MKSLEKAELKELLVKCWMTHDGMWFYHCLQECGIEKTNRINKAAGRALGMIEVKRILRAFGLEKIESFEDFKTLFDCAQQTIMGDFMHFSYSFPADNLFHVEMHDCFAYKGMRRIGAIDQYECGIFNRVEAWFDGLGIEYTVTPSILGCMKQAGEDCYRDYTLRFGKTG